MKRKTYNNVLRAVKMIEKKGYSREEAVNLADKVFNEHEK